MYISLSLNFGIKECEISKVEYTQFEILNLTYRGVFSQSIAFKTEGL